MRFYRDDSRHCHLSLVVVLLELGSLGVIDHLLDTLVDGEDDSLTGCDTEDTRSDTLVEGRDTLVLEHVRGDLLETGEGSLSGLLGCLLDTGLDSVNGSVGEWSHGTGDETEEHGLVRRKTGILVLRLEVLCPLLEVLVGSEVDTLVGSLAESGESNTTVESGESLLADNSVKGVGGIAVTGNISGVGQGVCCQI